MSGILGLWNIDGKPADHALLTAMNTQIAHRGPDGDGYWLDGPTGLAHQMFRITPESLKEVQPLATPHGVIVWDGRLDNRNELLALVDDVAPDAPDPALVLSLYRRFGEATPEKLIGDYAFAIWDPVRRKLLLVRDAIGIRPLYYCQAGRAFLFASEIKPILAHPEVRARPNDETLADWVLRFPGEDNRGTTFFEGIYSVPPSHMAVVSETGVSVRRYWDFDKMRKIRYPRYEEYVEGFQHYFDQAVRRTMRSAGPVTVSVSGGLDSSSIFCWAETQRRKAPGSWPELRAVSHVFPPGTRANEEVYLDAIEEQYGVKIHRIPATLVGPVGGAEDEVRRLETPMLDMQWAANRAYWTKIKETGARLALTGSYADDFLSGSAYLVDYLVQGRWWELWLHARRNPTSFREFPRLAGSFLVPRGLIRTGRRLGSPLVPHPWDHGLFAEPLRRRILERENSWKAFAGPVASVHAEYTYRRARSRFAVMGRESWSRLAAIHELDIAFPFLDRELLAFLTATPGNIVSVKELKKAILRSAMRGTLPSPVAARRNKGAVSHLFNPIVRQGVMEVLQVLSARGTILTDGYVDLGKIAASAALECESMDGKNTQAAKRWCDLLGVGVWLQVFFGSGGTNS